MTQQEKPCDCDETCPKCEKSWENPTKSSQGLEWREQLKDAYITSCIVDKPSAEGKGEVFIEKDSLEDYISQLLSRAKEEAIAREKLLKDMHTMELDAISCKSIEQFILWRGALQSRVTKEL